MTPSSLNIVPSARKRWLSAVVGGLITSVGLLWLMQVLIHHTDQPLDNSGNVSFLDFVRIKPIKRTSTRPEKPVEPKVIPKVPDIPPMQENQLTLSSPTPLRLNIKSTPAMEAGKFILAASEGSYLPLVRIAPMYPESARRRNIEGDCSVQFDVTSRGVTKNIKILDCVSHHFHRSSINAAARFRYQPRVEAGKPVTVIGVKTRFRYKLEN